MRTDVKIGLAVGLALLLIIVVYFAYKDVEKPDQPTADGAAAQTQPDSPIGSVALKSDGPASPAPSAKPALRPSRGPIIAPQPAKVVKPTPRPPSARRPRRSSVQIAPATTAPTVAAAKQPPIRRPVVAPAKTVTLPVPTAQPRVYVVRAGDSGFWGIAQKMYGDGKHMALIAQANPKVDPQRLRPGQRLVLPPLPAQRTTAATPQRLAGGQRIYTVQKGDKGFWTVAEKMYGHGKYWPRIAEANPDTNSNSLRAGKKLIIPPLSGTATASPSPIAARPGAVAQAPPSKYTVKVSDTTGFWGIAEKVYGDGRHWKLIAQANTGVDSGSLKAGQVLVIPPLTEASKVIATPPAAVGSRPPRPTPQPADDKDDGRPIFD